MEPSKCKCDINRTKKCLKCYCDHFSTLYNPDVPIVRLNFATMQLGKFSLEK